MIRMFWVYLVFYGLVTIGGLAGGIEDDSPGTQVLLELASAGLAFIGMLLYRLLDDAGRVGTFWKLPFFFIIGEQGYAIYLELRDVVRGGNVPVVIVIISVAAVVLVLLPSWIINWNLATGMTAATNRQVLSVGSVLHRE